MTLVETREAIEALAAEWDARLRSGACTASERLAFDDWLAENPEHRAAYARLQGALALLRSAATDPRIRAMRDGARLKVRQAQRRRWTRLTGAIAASVIAVIGGVWMVGETGAGEGRVAEAAAFFEGAQIYRTDLNERSHFTLADGSEVTLDSESRIKVSLNEGRRNVSLLSGRARFEVAKDPSRPFVVTAGDRNVTAVGTVFDVALTGRTATVTLVEGRVEVRERKNGRAAPVILTANQQLTPEHDVPVAVDVEKALGWTEGKLFFEDEPLGDAIAAMNRYSEHEIVLADPSLASLRINGMFRTGNQTGFVGALQATLPVQVTQDDQDRIVVSAAAR